jgi:hypothetical protein
MTSFHHQKLSLCIQYSKNKINVINHGQLEQNHDKYEWTKPGRLQTNMINERNTKLSGKGCNNFSSMQPQESNT